MANPTYRSSASAADQTADYSVSKPTGTADGDMLVAFQLTRIQTGAPTAPTGSWSVQLDQTAFSSGSTGGYYACYYRVASGEPASWTFHCPAGEKSSAYVIAIQNPTGTNLEGSSNTDGTGASADPGTYATTNTNDLILTAWMDTSGTALAITPDLSYTALATIGTAGSGSGLLRVGYKSQASPGVVSPRSAGIGPSEVWAAVLAAIAGPALVIPSGWQCVFPDQVILDRIVPMPY